MSNQLRTMGRRIMRKHKVLPSKRKRGGIPFSKWTQIVIQMLEERNRRAKMSIAEQLKAEAGKDEDQGMGQGTSEVQGLRPQDQGSAARGRRPSQGYRQAVRKATTYLIGRWRWIFALLAMGFAAGWFFMSQVRF